MKKKTISIAIAILMVVGIFVANITVKSEKTVKAEKEADPTACAGSGACNIGGADFAYDVFWH